MILQESASTEAPFYALKPKDFETDQDIRWCPGCGDYSILKQVQTIFPQLGLKREDIVIVSGIGCSSRFPYYMETYGIHSIHGRATAIASGLRIANPNLSIWIVTGDGDGLSIGGNHLLHFLRRNFNANILLFNNQIYGLTKGQYSPTSELNQVTKSTPMGSIDHPLNPLAFALGADAGFVARSMDRDPKHLQTILKRAHAHKGASFVEIYQNCNIFNDGAFFTFTDKETKPYTTLFVEQGQPLVFGSPHTGQHGVRLDGHRPQIVNLASQKNSFSLDDLWIHDETDLFKAQLLSRFFDDVHQMSESSDSNFLPRVFGVLYAAERPCYEDLLSAQVDNTVKKSGIGNLADLLAGKETWVIGG